MAKTKEQKREERLKRITELLTEREKINAELDKLTDVDAGNKEAKKDTASSVTPSGFVLTDAILAAFKQGGKEKLKIPEVVDIIATQTNFRPDRKNVQGTLYYMVTKKQVEKVGRGEFTLKV